MTLKPITLKQLVEWNRLVFLMALVALIFVGVVFFLLPPPYPKEPYVDLTTYFYSSSDETRRLVNDCVHNEHVIWFSLSTSRIPATVAVGVLSAASVLSGLSALFTYLLYKRLKSAGRHEEAL